MRWIKLFGSALADERLLNLLERLNYEGLGIYCAILMQVECIGEGCMQQEQVISSFNRRVRRKRILSVINDYGLFHVSDFNFVTSVHPFPGEFLADTGAPTGADTGETRAGTRKRRVEKSNNNDDVILKPVLRFRKPTIEEIREYCTEKGYDIDAEHFYDYNETRGWMVGKQLMKSWKGALATWVRRECAFRTGNREEDLSPVKASAVMLETTDSQGNRYVDGRLIPKDAPPRPSANAIWDDASGTWFELYH